MLHYSQLSVSGILLLSLSRVNSFSSVPKPTEARATVTERRTRAPRCVSERHNQAYKESIKLFAGMERDHELPSFGPYDVLSHAPHDDCWLIHETTTPLISAEACEAVVAESELWAQWAGGWTSTRHFNHPTTDIPLQELPRTRSWFNQACLTRIYPLLAHCFEGALPNPRALRVADAFIVKYNAAGGQTHLKPHRDGSVVSFNIALNER
jgi:hypothetical protein